MAWTPPGGGPALPGGVIRRRRPRPAPPPELDLEPPVRGGAGSAHIDPTQWRDAMLSPLPLMGSFRNGRKLKTRVW